MRKIMPKIRIIRRKTMKGFVCINTNCYVNEDLIDKEKTHDDSKRDKVVVCDIYGNQYFVDKDLVRDLIKVK